MAPLVPRKKSAGRSTDTSKKGESAKGRDRSGSRRRRIRAEVGAREKSARDIFALQERLLDPGVGTALLDAAVKLLQPKDYECVVEERSVEGLCGFPPCEAAAVGCIGGKKYSLKRRTFEVYEQDAVGRYCSLECMHESLAFAARLEPEPAYFRPASVVAAARCALAASEGAASPINNAKACSRGAHNLEAIGAARVDANHHASVSAQPNVQAADGEAKLFPKIRPRAIVRFSREQHSYSVHYSEYDGGPPMVSEVVPRVEGNVTNLAAQCGITRASGEDCHRAMARFLAAPILERGISLEQATKIDAGLGVIEQETAALRPPLVDAVCQKDGTSNAEGKLGVSISVGVDGAGDNADEDGGCTTEGEALEAGSSGDDFFEVGAAYKAPPIVSPFVHAWGVLSSLMTEDARAALHNGNRSVSSTPAFGPPSRGRKKPVNAPMAENANEGGTGAEADDGAEHKDRRTLHCRQSVLRETISARVPPDLAFLAPRVDDVVLSMAVHQALPSISERSLYDLIAALLLRSLLVSDARRPGMCGSQHGERLLDAERALERAAARLGIGDPKQLEALDSLLQP